VSRLTVNKEQRRSARLTSACRRCAVLITGAALTFAHPLRACDCVASPACFHVTWADVIFIGKVTYSNHYESGGWAQRTLIRFEVEETFKGLSTNDHEVWIDPGSFTSCYAEYPIGHRYLVFASSRWGFFNTAIMSIYKGPLGLKPPPPGFDLSHPPKVYFAPECSGTQELSGRPDDIVASDLAYLRAWREGKSVTRVYGRVLDDHTPAWPDPSAPGLQGATVTLEGAGQKLSALTDSKGAYSFDGIPAGQYSLEAALDGYRAFPPGVNYDLAPGTCGYGEFNMLTDGLLEGMVKDFRGHPATKIELVLQRVLSNGSVDFMGLTTTDQKGTFQFSDLPRADFRLGVNIDRQPTVEVPYALSYYPGTSQPSSIHLELHEHRKGLIFNLPPPLKTRVVNVVVTWADSSPVANASVLARFKSGGVAEMTQTDRQGKARLVCLADVPYQIEAAKWLPPHQIARVAAHSERYDLPAKPWTGVMKLVMDRTSRFF